jgi:putative hydrolase of the HAD superfamily
MIKAVIFDLNGIFIQSSDLSESERFKKDFNVSAQDFFPKLESVLEKIRQPNSGGSFQYWKPILKEWKVNLSEREFWDYMFGVEKVSETMVSFARELKNKGMKVFILSNTLKEAALYYREHYPWMDEAIDKLYFSFQTGFKKPDKRAWENILSDNNLKPEECIYFDDQEKHLQGCQSVGIKSFLFTNEKDLQNKIKELL